MVRKAFGDEGVRPPRGSGIAGARAVCVGVALLALAGTAVGRPENLAGVMGAGQPPATPVPAGPSGEGAPPPPGGEAPADQPGAGAANPEPGAGRATGSAAGQAQGQAPAPAKLDEPEFPVSEFLVEYKIEHPGLPTMADLLAHSVVELGVVEGGYVAPRAGIPVIRISLAELNERISGRRIVDPWTRGEPIPPPGMVGPAAKPVAAKPVAAKAAAGAAAGVPKFSGPALWAVLRSLVTELHQHGLVSVLAETNNADMELDVRAGGITLHDLRGDDNRTTLRIMVYTAIVTRVRTIAAGDRIPPPRRTTLPGSEVGVGGGAGGGGAPGAPANPPVAPPVEGGEKPAEEEGPIPPEESRLDNPMHQRIRDHSPVQPAGPNDTERKDLVRKDLLDDYVLRLSRYPNRHVDVAIAGADDPSGVGVEVSYLVRESDPLTVYAQLSNTGTKETSVWRERAGIQDSQLTNNDDFLLIDYVTGGFSESHQVSGSYEFPLGDDRLRLKLSALYSSFDASEVGASDERFKGQTWFAGADLAWNFFQHREVFLDATAGLRYQNLRVDNETVDVSGHTGFLLPSFGLRGERVVDTASTLADMQVMFNAPNAATNDSQINQLGRLDAESRFTVLSWNAQQSFFLEPLLAPNDWEAGKSTLAHEIALSVHGQYAFDSRLVPNFEQIAGGLYTVRGYDESIAAGDDVVIASAEYRLHIPRLLSPSSEPGTLFGKPFNWRPPQAYARPDWDLVFKTFFDGGWTHNNKALSFEHDDTLLSTGVGLEFLYKSNFTVRLDWGVVLHDVPGKAQVGDNRLHFVATFLF